MLSVEQLRESLQVPSVFRVPLIVRLLLLAGHSPGRLQIDPDTGYAIVTLDDGGELWVSADREEGCHLFVTPGRDGLATPDARDES